VIEQSAISANRAMIHYGGEASSYTGQLLIEGNEFINHRNYNVAVFNQTPIVVRIECNVFHNVDVLSVGPAQNRNNIVYDDLSNVGLVDLKPGSESSLPSVDGESLLRIIVPEPGDASTANASFEICVSSDCRFRGDVQMVARHGTGTLGACEIQPCDAVPWIDDAGF